MVPGEGRWEGSGLALGLVWVMVVGMSVADRLEMKQEMIGDEKKKREINVVMDEWTFEKSW